MIKISFRCPQAVAGFPCGALIERLVDPDTVCAVFCNACRLYTWIEWTGKDPNEN